MAALASTAVSLGTLAIMERAQLTLLHLSSAEVHLLMHMYILYVPECVKLLNTEVL